MKSVFSILALIVSFSVSLLPIDAKAATFESKYSPLADASCKMLESSEMEPNPQIDYFKSICPGNDGLQVKYLGGDTRSWIGILKAGQAYADGAEFYAPLMTGAKGQFANVEGTQLEWRYADQKLVAFILRMGAQDAEDFTKTLVNLVVLRVDPNDFAKTCLIGSVDTTTVVDPNTAARAIADDLTKQCP